MTREGRIPICATDSILGVRRWFNAMSSAGLLFHPDDDPASISAISDGTALFSKAEVNEIRKIIKKLFRLHGDEVYEAAHPFFMDVFATRKRNIDPHQFL